MKRERERKYVNIRNETIKGGNKDRSKGRKEIMEKMDEDGD